jgi:molecular chaperone Hsp33
LICEDAKQPFTGQVMLKYGNIAKDLANYYLTSEQVPTAFNLSIKFDPDGQVTGAGGLFLQAMPQADDDLADSMEARVTSLPSLGEVFTGEEDPQALVATAFKDYSPRFLANHRIEFMCHCIFGIMGRFRWKSTATIAIRPINSPGKM